MIYDPSFIFLLLSKLLRCIEALWC